MILTLGRCEEPRFRGASPFSVLALCIILSGLKCTFSAVNCLGQGGPREVTTGLTLILLGLLEPSQCGQTQGHPLVLLACCALDIVPVSMGSQKLGPQKA